MEGLRVNIILPKTLIESVEYGRVYYLAGPIRGADDWQSDAVRILAKIDPYCTIVCPCRWGEEHPLWEHRLTSSYVSAKTYERQTDWERDWMSYAAEHGCLVFWIPCESKTHPRPKECGPYARDTYGELGRYSYMVSRDQNRYKMVVGADPNLPEGFGMSQIGRNLDGDFLCYYPIRASLEKTLSVAVEYAKL